MPPNVSLVIPELLLVAPRKGEAKLDGEFEAALELLAASAPPVSFAGVTEPPALPAEAPPQLEAMPAKDKRPTLELAGGPVIEALAAMMIPATMTPPQSPATQVEPPAEGAAMETPAAGAPTPPRPQPKATPTQPAKSFATPAESIEAQTNGEAVATIEIKMLAPDRTPIVDRPHQAKIETAVEASAFSKPGAEIVEASEIAVNTKDEAAKIEFETASRVIKPDRAANVQRPNTTVEGEAVSQADKPWKDANVQGANPGVEQTATMVSHADKPESASKNSLQARVPAGGPTAKTRLGSNIQTVFEKAVSVQHTSASVERETISQTDKPEKATNAQSANANTEQATMANRADKSEGTANVQRPNATVEREAMSRADKPPEKAVNFQPANIAPEPKHETTSQTDRIEIIVNAQPANTEHEMTVQADRPENATSVQPVNLATAPEHEAVRRADNLESIANPQPANMAAEPKHETTSRADPPKSAANVQPAIMATVPALEMASHADKPESSNNVQPATAFAERETASHTDRRENTINVESQPAKASPESKAVHAGAQMETLTASMREQAVVLNRQLRHDSGNPARVGAVRNTKPLSHVERPGIGLNIESQPTNSAAEAAGHIEKPNVAVKVEAGDIAPVEAMSLPAKPANESAPAASPAATRPAVTKLPEPLRPVVMTLRNLAAEGREEVRLQLQPESLGPVEVRLHYDGAEVRVHLAAETAQTSALLQNHAPDLRAALVEAGVSVGQLSVTVGDGRSAGSHGWAGSQGGPAFAPGGANDNERAPREPAATPARFAGVRSASASSSRVDYRV